MKRRVQAERAARARAKTSGERREADRGVSRAVAGVNHLEIPADLAFIFSRLDGQSDTALVTVCRVGTTQPVRRYRTEGKRKESRTPGARLF